MTNGTNNPVSNSSVLADASSAQTYRRTEAQTVTVAEIDDSVIRHVAAEYWQWLDLFQRDRMADIALHPEAVILEAIEAYAGTKTKSLLFKQQEDGKFSAAAALVPKTLRPRSVAGLGLLPPLHGYRLAGKQIVGRHDKAAMAALMTGVAAHVRDANANFLLVEDLEQGSTLHEQLNELVADGFRLFSPTGFQERLRIRLPDDPNQYWGRFSSKSRNTFRRKIKKLGDVRFERITQPEQVADFLSRAHKISRNTWQSERLGLRVQNDGAELRQFVFQASQGAFRSYLLLRGEESIAFLIGNQLNGRFHYEEVGYDSDFARLSPGQVLLLKALEDLFEHDTPEWFDFGGGDAEYKRLFANHVSRSGHVWVVPRSWLMDAVLCYLRACRRGDKILRAFLTRTGLITDFRQFVRRAGRRRNYRYVGEP